MTCIKLSFKWGVYQSLLFTLIFDAMGRLVQIGSSQTQCIDYQSRICKKIDFSQQVWLTIAIRNGKIVWKHGQMRPVFFITWVPKIIRIHSTQACMKYKSINSAGNFNSLCQIWECLVRNARWEFLPTIASAQVLGSVF